MNQAGGPGTANPSRVYDAMLGGKDNYAADRAVAEKLAAAKPALLANVRANRAYLGRVVRYLATECGIRTSPSLGWPCRVLAGQAVCRIRSCFVFIT